MKNLNLILLLVALAIAPCFTGCDPAYPPVIINDYESHVEISLSFFAGHAEQTGLLESKNAFLQRYRGLKIREIKVKVPDGTIRTYGAEELERARSKKTVSMEVWILTREGVRLGDENDLRENRGRR